MMKKLWLLIAIPFVFLLTGCPYNPETMPVWTAEQICEYMNKNFDGYFELTDSKREDSYSEKTCTAYMTCDKFPEELIITNYGYYNSELSWTRTFTTNYHYFLYKSKIEEKAAGFIQEKFSDFSYKLVNACEQGGPMAETKQYKNMDDYLNSVYAIGFYVAIDASDEEIKRQLEIKEKSILYDKNKDPDSIRNISFYVYLIEDSFNSLTQTEILRFPKYEAFWL